MRNSCVFEFPRRRMSEQPFPVNYTQWRDPLDVLRRKSGIHDLERNELFSPHFFVREALRFIARPNPALRRLMTDLLHTDFVIQSSWQPFQAPHQRVAVHIRAGEDKKAHTGVLGTEYYSRIIGRLQPDQEKEEAAPMQVLFSSDSREAHTEFAEYLNAQNGKQGQFIAQSRFGALASLVHDELTPLNQTELIPDTDIGMLLMAQAYVFSTADVFIGFIPSNIGQTVHLLMGALRHTSILPVFDSGGSSMSACHHFTEYPLRIIRHLALK